MTFQKLILDKSESKYDLKQVGLIYFADGKPVPLVLTEEELISLLRLDLDGPKHPSQTLQYYRDKGLLKGVQVGKRLRYFLPDIIEFLEEQSAYFNRKNVS